MHQSTKSFLGGVALFSACYVGASVLLIREYSVGTLSSASFAVSLCALSIVGLALFVLLALRLARAVKPIIANNESSPDPEIRNRRLWGIRAGQAFIALMFLSLINGLYRFRHGPVLPVVVGTGMNLLITFSIVWFVLRLKKSIK